MIQELVEFIARRLKEDMIMNAKFPFDTKTPKSKKKKPHMRDTVFSEGSTHTISPDLRYFELGNEEAERLTPHYHILEDAKIIRFPYEGTKTSRGSQRLIADKGKRDYGQFVYVRSRAKKNPSGYRVVQEYRQNMTRNYDGTKKSITQPREYRKRQEVSNIHKRNYRYNKHYQYIERILYDVAKGLAIEKNLKLKIGNIDSMYDPTIAIEGDPTSGYQQVAGYLDTKNGVSDYADMIWRAISGGNI
jgi:hypothetical protein